MKNKIYYIETKNGTLWYVEKDGVLFDSNSRGFVFDSLNLPPNIEKKDLKEFNLDICSDYLSFCETNSVVLNEK
jgi:hypothetical protein